jgi:hypothetical protein
MDGPVAEVARKLVEVRRITRTIEVGGWITRLPTASYPLPECDVNSQTLQHEIVSRFNTTLLVTIKKLHNTINRKNKDGVLTRTAISCD